jgi:hypothetical protein
LSPLTRLGRRFQEAQQHLVALPFGSVIVASHAEDLNMPTDREIEIFDGFMHALGTAVFAWNDMIECLGILFGGVMYPGSGVPPTAFAVWHSTNSDRIQIETLRAAARVAKRPDGNPLDPDGKIDWLCERAHNLANARNNVVHTPMTYETQDGEISEIRANQFFKHPRAKQLADKNMMDELDWLEDRATRLRDYALALSLSVQIDKHPLPDKPQLPNRGRRKSR